MEGDHRENHAQSQAEEIQDLVEDEIQELVDRTVQLVIDPVACVRQLEEIIENMVQELIEEIVQTEVNAEARVEPRNHEVETPAQIALVQRLEVELQGQVEEQASGLEPEGQMPQKAEASGELNAIVLNYLDLVRNIKFEEILYASFLEATKAEAVSSEYNNIEELYDDLFNSDPSWALAHCVSADLAMFRGIAVEFKKRFNNCQFLKKQNVKVGYVAVQNYFAHDDIAKNGRFVIYLVTKELYNHRPTYFSIYCSLVRMRNICEALHITKIAMPQIGSGCDRMDFRQVKHLIHTVFLGSDIEIRVYIKF